MVSNFMLSYISLFLVLAWSILYILAFCGTQWVVLELNIKPVHKPTRLRRAALGTKKGLKTTQSIPWYKKTTTKPYTQYPTTEAYHTPEIISHQYNTMTPETGLNVLSSILPESYMNEFNSLISSPMKFKIIFNLGFRKFCSTLKVDGNIELVKMVDVSACLDSEIIKNPEKYGIPKEFLKMYEIPGDRIVHGGRTSMIVGVTFAAVAVILSILKPVFLNIERFRLPYFSVMGIVFLIALSCGAAGIGYAEEDQNSLNSQIRTLTNSLMTASSDYTTGDMNSGFGTCIVYMAIGLLVLLASIGVNIFEYRYLKKMNRDQNYANFDMKVTS